MADTKKYDSKCAEMKENGYKKAEYILSTGYTYTMGLLIPLPLLLLNAVIYNIRWGNATEPLNDFNYIYLLIGTIVTTVIHEALHGLCWSFFCKDGFKSIKFGVSKGLPYCHCDEPMEKKGYAIGTLAPLAVLWGALLIVQCIYTSSTIFLLTMINILSAGGDILIVLKMRGLRDVYIVDHPNLPGFTSFEK